MLVFNANAQKIHLQSRPTSRGSSHPCIHSRAGEEKTPVLPARNRPMRSQGSVYQARPLPCSLYKSCSFPWGPDLQVTATDETPSCNSLLILDKSIFEREIPGYLLQVNIGKCGKLCDSLKYIPTSTILLLHIYPRETGTYVHGQTLRRKDTAASS